MLSTQFENTFHRATLLKPTVLQSWKWILWNLSYVMANHAVTASTRRYRTIACEFIWFKSMWTISLMQGFMLHTPKRIVTISEWKDRIEWKSKQKLQMPSQPYVPNAKRNLLNLPFTLPMDDHSTNWRVGLQIREETLAETKNFEIVQVHPIVGPNQGVLVRSGPGKPNRRKVSSWAFHRGLPEQKFNMNRACFPKEKHQNSQKWAKFMNFSFWPFL